MNPIKLLRDWRQTYRVVKEASLLSPIDTGRSWWSVVRESFTGAWQRNVTVDRDSVLAYWAVYACIRLISSDIAKMRLKLVEKGANGIWSEIEVGSPFLPLLRKPNSYQTRVQFFQYWYSCLLIHGNCYALKQRDERGMVKALYILDPLAVTVLVSEDGGVYYRLRRDNLSGRGELIDVTVPASEIIHDRMVCLHHPLVGVSPIFACGLAATQGLSVQNNSANFFANGSMPGGVITVPGALDPAKAALLKASWETGYAGENRGKVAVLADKMTYQPLSITAHDAQLIEQLRMTAEVVCSTFGVPAYKVGVVQPPANSNVAAQDQNYYSQCLQILIENTEAVLDEGLGLVDVPGKTMGVEFDKEALIGMDPMAQMDFVDKGVRGSIFSPNEGRAKFDRQPVKGGESPLSQQQYYSLEALAERDAAKPLAAPAPALPPPAEDDDQGDDEASEEVRAFLKSLEREFACA